MLIIPIKTQPRTQDPTRDSLPDLLLYFALSKLCLTMRNIGAPFQSQMKVPTLGMKLELGSQSE